MVYEAVLGQTSPPPRKSPLECNQNGDYIKIAPSSSFSWQPIYRIILLTTISYFIFVSTAESTEENELDSHPAHASSVELLT